MQSETLAIQSTILHEHTGAVTPPLYLTSTYERQADGSFDAGNYIYSRLDNPNRRVLEKSLAAIEQGGSEAFTFASGLAAIAALFQTLKAGNHVIMPEDAYFGALVLAEDIFVSFGLESTRIDQRDLQAVNDAIRPNTKLIWIESPSNPQLRLADIEAIASIAKPKGILTAIDNTLATPLLQQPLALGADVAMYSTTKYFGGHSDVLGGALVIGDNPMLGERLRRIQKICGAVPSPFDCWLVARGIRTMPLRVKYQTASAQLLAQHLENHPAIEKVFYPGLPSFPQYALAKKQMRGFGAMLSIQVRGGQQEAMALAHNLQLFTHATSLGGVESLIEHRKSVEGNVSQTPENLLRISVGIEAPQDLIADFDQALQCL